MNTSQKCFRAAVLAVIVCTPALAAEADYVVGITLGFTPGTAPMVRIDPATGAYSTLSTTANSYNALAQDAAGDLYAGWFSSSASNGRVSRISPFTGAPLQTFNAITPGAGSIRGLGFDQTNRLLAIVNRDDLSGSPTLPDDLYEINLAHQTTTRIGSLGFLSVQGFDVSPNGSHFAWDIDAGLLLVDPLSGAAVDVNPGIGGTVAIQSIMFAPDGRLFGAGRELYSIQPVTGAFQQVGAGGGPDVRGIEWIVPEPSGAILLLGFGAATILIRRALLRRDSVLP
jgi:hypothetical protein